MRCSTAFVFQKVSGGFLILFLEYTGLSIHHINKTGEWGGYLAH